jgi:hypothetical protein
LILSEFAQEYLRQGNGGAMSAYRIYELTAHDHVASAPTIVDCPDDAAAIEKARQCLSGHIIEVWQIDRCAIRMQPVNLG